MKIIFGWILAAVVLLLVFATLLPLFEAKQWWIRAIGFPRLQTALFSLAAAAALLLVYRRSRFARATAAVLVAAALYQFTQIYPYTPLAREQSLPATRYAPQRSISVMICNVLMRNRNVEAFAAAVRSSNPDVILAVETDEWWAQQLRFLETLYPYVEREPLANTYGMILMSRRRLSDVQVRHLVEDSIPSIRAGVELPSGETIDLYCLHPRPPIPGSNSDQRDAELILVAREVRGRNRPAIVAGDLNDVAWSQTTELFQEISGMLDPRIGRGMYNSYHAGYFLLRYPLDHVFHTNHFRLIGMRRLEAIGSDHFPIFIELSFEPENAGGQPRPSPEQEDLQDARENVQEGTDGDR
ncbi:MAG TPA: endonuclease/exonuclease/phosphatase family protein [Candidatus Kapabacteria bacterium]|nr:endonuclease/exonuclease/phosphatase family protein [Candidatus Kapabacteria bacterium]